MISTTEALKMAIEALEVADKALNEFFEGLAKLGVPKSILKLDTPTNLIPAINACKKALESQEQAPVDWMKSAIDNARDVCKYLDHGRINDAMAHTKFFWADLDKIRKVDDE